MNIERHFPFFERQFLQGNPRSLNLQHCVGFAVFDFGFFVETGPELELNSTHPFPIASLGPLFLYFMPSTAILHDG